MDRKSLSLGFGLGCGGCRKVRVRDAKPSGKLENKLTGKRSKLPQSLASFKSTAFRNY